MSLGNQPVLKSEGYEVLEPWILCHKFIKNANCVFIYGDNYYF